MKELLLKNKSFALLIIGKLVSLLGDNIQSFALSLYVLKTTGSAARFGSVLVLSFIPELIIGPIAGVFTDWLDRKKIVVFADLINAAVIGVFAVIFLLRGELTITNIYILVVLLSLTSALFNPAVSSIIPLIVEKEQLVDANGMNSMIMSIGSLVAPVIAGIVMDKVGIFIILVINSLSFLVSSISEMFIIVPKHNKEVSGFKLATFKEDFIEGLRYIKNSKELMTIITLAATVNFALTPLFEVGIIYIYKNILMVTDTDYGFIQTIIAASALVAPILASYISKKLSSGKIIFYGTFLISFFSLSISVVIFNPLLKVYSSTIIPITAIAILTSAETVSLAVVNIVLNSIMQKTIPSDMLGRINSAMYTVLSSTIPLGQMVFGILYDDLPTTITVLISGVILFAVTAAFKNRIFTLDDTATGGLNVEQK